jgi:hypothetical protein
MTIYKTALHTGTKNVPISLFFNNLKKEFASIF